ncbi:hypothetical protein VTJ49DRAFT_1158 [Mycothermus thermophilus]|uniref:Shugoshin C-terminal domain-containing protein n=1 Tax=Humicola insolens TaxID=85995 RepID=A0ABR3VD39_HUMIN
MADEAENQDVIFGVSNKPWRTYSSRRNSRTTLPSLKPTPMTSTTARAPIRLGRLAVVQAEEEVNGVDVDLLDVPDAEDETIPHTSPSEHILHSVEDEESSESPEEPSDDSIDDDDELSLSPRRPSTASTKHDHLTANGMRSLRKRPFLVSNRIEAKGFKQLKSESKNAKTPPASRHKLGDGFTGPEAKPNGANLLRKNGKLVTGPTHLGMLDLTQASSTEKGRKRSSKRAGLDDNSFTPVAAKKKKVRRPLAPKDANQFMSAAEVKVRNPTASQIVIPATLPASPQPVAPRHDASAACKPQPQDAITEENQPVPKQAASEANSPQLPPETVQQTTSNKGTQEDEVDLIVIPRSDEIEGGMAKITKPEDVSDGGQISDETHVTDTPQRGCKPRAKSTAGEMGPGQAIADIRQSPVGRRRAKTG